MLEEAWACLNYLKLFLNYLIIFLAFNLLTTFGFMHIQLRIWTYDSSTPASRNATIYCGAEIMSLEWECKSDRLLLIGTADGGIKAWNVDAKRVVCDLNTTEAFPSVLDLKCSPVEPIFVSAAASRGYLFNLNLQLSISDLT
ncbi:hypothetical protein Pint_17586 [Pistacia integerrima]|uniref:Uncharacterized protein n=1 Tax=Pistacia integerrima TaxID=434235 RepID=A0ACC0YZJ5_9ROSI|nr:hypothetical protein Pint_17586 [Pistacia integerrima]